MKALTVTTDGTVTENIFDNDTAYQTIRDGVGGYIEAVTIDFDITMWVHEEGKLLDLPHNKFAQQAWNRTHGEFSDYIVGDVVFTGGSDDEGYTLGLTPEAEDKVRKILALATV